mmetsp:Transcript_7702/g.11663  ORF Transcript_7702/g.11663 Transcript_7702/m.11663 type:complete len:258 (+) Transcript_7702:159-932(+)
MWSCHGVNFQKNFSSLPEPIADSLLRYSSLKLESPKSRSIIAEIKSCRCNQNLSLEKAYTIAEKNKLTKHIRPRGGGSLVWNLEKKQIQKTMYVYEGEKFVITPVLSEEKRSTVLFLRPVFDPSDKSIAVVQIMLSKEGSIVAGHLRSLFPSQFEGSILDIIMSYSHPTVEEQNQMIKQGLKPLNFFETGIRWYDKNTKLSMLPLSTRFSLEDVSYFQYVGIFSPSLSLYWRAPGWSQDQLYLMSHCKDDEHFNVVS